MEPTWRELEGVVVPLAELEAPLSGLRCVLYRVALGPLQRLLEGSTGASREIAGVRFLLRTGAGLVLVDAGEAEQLELRRRLRRRYRLGADGASDRRLLALYQRLQRSGPSRRTVSGSEARLESGERLLLGGTISSCPDPRGLPAGYREPPRLPLLRAQELRVLPW
jgi:hypothetical protein